MHLTEWLRTLDLDSLMGVTVLARAELHRRWGACPERIREDLPAASDDALRLLEVPEVDDVLDAMEGLKGRRPEYRREEIAAGIKEAAAVLEGERTLRALLEAKEGP